MELSLFDFKLPENNEPEDNTRLTLVNLYFSQTEKARFNELCKKGMEEYYGIKVKESNSIDFLLELLERSFGDKRSVPTVHLDTRSIIAALETAKNQITQLEQRINGNNNS